MPNRIVFLISCCSLYVAVFFVASGCVITTPSDGISKTVVTSEAMPILIGVEYAMPGMADTFGELGLTAVKQYPDEIRWDRMQKSAKAEIDFSKTDSFVTEYQTAGFTDLVIALKSHNIWASKNFLDNPTPKEEYLDLYKAWVAGVVERYDGDGTDDMPGLRWPVVYYEIGTEFSSYEPEPVEDYLVMLEAAYQAAHTASDEVVIAHAAFLTITVFDDRPTTAEYEAAFGGASDRIMEHSLSDIRAVLDRPEIFDAVNFHSLGSPYEIEDNVKWLKYEMARRNYDRPIIVSDTAVTPFAGYGPATICDSQPAKMALLARPTEEKDRCRLADYFNQLISGNEAVMAWERAFAAGDVVKRTLIAAEQKIILINLAFMEEMAFFQTKLFHAAAGNTSWAGMTETKMNWLTQKREVVKKFPSFFALKQAAGYLSGAESVKRIDVGDEDIRWYKISKQNQTVHAVWYEPTGLILHGDKVPTREFSISVKQTEVVSEQLITKQDQLAPESRTITVVDGGLVALTLTPTPVFVLE